MFEADTTKLFEPINPDDILHTNGTNWVIRKRCVVRVADITDPYGIPLAADNWRSSYINAKGNAVFASHIEGTTEKWIAQIRHLEYVDENGQTRVTNDIMRTSAGSFIDEGSKLMFVTKRTKYLFYVVE